jgi:protein-S-isoprenylcysteine O-methyltransferase Ste14
VLSIGVFRRGSKEGDVAVRVTVAGTFAYLGQAILRWGGVSTFFSHPALVALAIVLFAQAVTALSTEGNVSSDIRGARDNRWVLAAFAVIGLFAAFLLAYTDRIGFWILDGDTLRWLDVFLFAAGGALRPWPVFVLGRRFSGFVAIQPDHKRVLGGIYAVIRHPSYLGLLIVALGWALAFRSAVGVLLTAMTVPPLIARIRAEEALLASDLGEAYATPTAPSDPRPLLNDIAGGEARGTARPRLRRLGFAIARRGIGDEADEELACRPCDILDGTVEDLPVGPGRTGEAAELANELQGRGADFGIRRRRREVVQRLDVAAHVIPLAHLSWSTVLADGLDRPHLSAKA